VADTSYPGLLDGESGQPQRLLGKVTVIYHDLPTLTFSRPAISGARLISPAPGHLEDR
jgi:hypothetical protein